MIKIKTNSFPSEQWNSRLLQYPLGTIYHTIEYAKFVKSRDWKPIFLEFMNENDKIVGQVLISIQPRFQNKGNFKKILKFAPRLKKNIYRWAFGPVIFDSKYNFEIHSSLYSYLLSENCLIYGSEHPLNCDVFKNNDSGISFGRWGTFVVDLSQDIDMIWKNFDKHSARKNIERSKNRGVSIEEINQDNLREYYTLLQETKDKVGWNISYQEIESLWNFLKPVGFTGFLARYDKKPVGGILISFFNNYINEWGVGRSIIDYTGKLYSQDLLKWHIINWGKENNCTFYDLSGVNPEPISDKEKGIFRFKKKWGGRFIEYKTCKN